MTFISLEVVATLKKMGGFLLDVEKPLLEQLEFVNQPDTKCWPRTSRVPHNLGLKQPSTFRSLKKWRRRLWYTPENERQVHLKITTNWNPEHHLRTKPFMTLGLWVPNINFPGCTVQMKGDLSEISTLMDNFNRVAKMMNLKHWFLCFGYAESHINKNNSCL